MTIRDQVHAWLAGRPLWQQALAREVARTPSLEGEAYEAALARVLVAHRAMEDSAEDPAESVEPIELDELPGADPVTATPRIVRFGNLIGVGAAVPGQVIDFAPDGITVVYGPNASGKSTYVRALKRLTRTVDLSEILHGDVLAPQESRKGGPRATIWFTEAGQQTPRELQEDLDAVDEPLLDSISVFDARCAELYVTARNKVAYVPVELRLLTRLGILQNRLRETIREMIVEVEASLPSFDEFDRPGSVRDYLDALSAESDLREAERLAGLTDAERRRLEELQSALASATSPQVQADVDAARQDAAAAREFAKGLRDLVDRLSEARISTLRQVFAAHEQAQESVRLAAATFANLPVTGIGESPWRALWEAARGFVEAYGGDFPPGPGAACPLCVQELSGDAAERLAHFEQHVTAAVQDRAGQAREQLRQAQEGYDPEQVSGLRERFLQRIEHGEAELHAELADIVSAVEERYRTLFEDPGADVTPVEAELDTLEAWAATREEHAETLAQAADPDRRVGLQAEADELDAQHRLSARLPDVEAAIAKHQRIARLQEAWSALATNAISTKQRELSAVAVTETLAKSLDEELGRLGCGHVPLELQTQTTLAESSVGLGLAGVDGTPKISDILSEGEQRAVALAFFFAEVGVSEGDGGLILDDPVSSLDEERRTYIADRLVEEAHDRQVIVFTHALPFMLELLTRAEDAGVVVQARGIWRSGDQVGRIDVDPPFPAMKLKERVGKLKQEVQEWDARPEPQDFDEAWSRVCDFYNRLRQCWERAVEERLFRGVVTRFQREVKTLGLDASMLTDERVAEVQAGMDRCNEFVHDNPPAAGTTLPGRSELEADLGLLAAFEKETRS